MAELSKIPRLKRNGVEEHDGDVNFRPEVEIRPFRACAMHPAII